MTFIHHPQAFLAFIGELKNKLLKVVAILLFSE